MICPSEEKPIRDNSGDIFAVRVFRDWWFGAVTLDPAFGPSSCLRSFPSLRVSGAGKGDYMKVARPDLHP